MSTQPNRFAIKPLKLASFKANSLVIDTHFTLFPHEGQKLNINYSLQIVAEPGAPLYTNGNLNANIEIEYSELEELSSLSEIRKAILEKVLSETGAVLA